MERNCEEGANCDEFEFETLLKEWIDGDLENLTNLFDYVQCIRIQKNDETKEWFDRAVLCYVLREDVLERIDKWKLELHWIIDGICLSSSINIQNELKRMLDSKKNQMNTKQCAFNGKLCEAIRLVLLNCKDRYESNDSSSQQVYAQIFDYLMELIEECEDQETIERALSALVPFPFNKHQSEWLKLIDSVANRIGNQLTKWCRWNKILNKILCNIISQNVLEKRAESLSQRTYDKLFDYLTKIIDQSENKGTIDCAWRTLKNFPIKQILTKLLQNNSQSSELNWRMHQNWLNRLFQNGKANYGDISKENMNLWLLYLANILHKCDHMQLVLLAIFLLEKLCLREYFDVESEDVLKSELIGRVQSLDSECPLAHSLPDEFDFDRYQVEWCARWCVHNVMDRDKRKEMGGKLPLIKLSNDRFEARNERIGYGPTQVRSQYCVSSGVYFYEVTIATDERMIFGWSTYDAVLDGLNYDDDECNMPRKLIYRYDGEIRYIFAQLSDCHAGDVIGCLIDMDMIRFVFYCNGKEVMSDNEESLYENINQKQTTFFSYPFYATALLSYDNHCYFNFGQVPFKFSPNHIEFTNFHNESRNDSRMYRLIEASKTISRDIWMKHFPVDNQVNLFYSDKRQNECDELVKRVERDIAEGREVEEIKKELGCTRYIQAVIEEMGNEQEGDKVDVMAQWVGRVIHETIEDINKGYYRNRNLRLRLPQLLYPYLHLRINSTFDYTKHRNICIVLSNLIRFFEYYGYNFIDYIRKEVFTYLTRTLTETSDEWTQLFGFIAFENLKLNKDEKEIIQKDTRIMSLLNNYTNTSKCLNAFEMSSLEHCRSLSYQLHFASERFLRNVLNRQIKSDQSTQPTLYILGHTQYLKVSLFKRMLRHSFASQTNSAVLNINYQTRYLKVSHNLLSVRSDLKWQSVRYDCSGENRIIYFEVLLLTNGPMRIGWSTKRTELDETKLGEDEFSISFNGHSRVMYHQNTPSPAYCIPQWKAGDVVGCLMCNETRRFYFFLNGHPLPLPDKLYFSPQLPYYPSLSLSAHQQVYCNFGQSNFRYPQPNIEFLKNFLYIQKELRLHVKPKTPIDLSNSSFTNAIVAIKSKTSTRDIIFNHQSQSNISPQPALASTSTISEKHDAQQQNVVLIKENSRLKLRNAELEKDNQELKKDFETLKALKCDSLTTVHAECCDHLKFCTKCGSAMGSCVGAKCNRK